MSDFLVEFRKMKPASLPECFKNHRRCYSRAHAAKVIGISKDHVETLAELTKDQLRDCSLETEHAAPDLKQGFADI